MNEQKLVSIIIPTYKRSEMLPRAIESLLKQSYSNIEIIVVDDNGDNEFRHKTEKVIFPYLKDERIKYIKRETRGGGSLARNTGIQHASGEYITFLDDDDEYYLDKIEVQVEEMEKGFDMIFSGYDVFSSENSNVVTHLYKRDFNFSWKSLLTKHLVSRIHGTPTFMYRKESLIRIGCFPDISANQENLLMLNTIVNKLEIGYINKALVKVYLHDEERISSSEYILDAKIMLLNQNKKHWHHLTLRQRRKAKFKLYLYIIIVSWKMRDKRFFNYIFYIFLFPELFLFFLFSKLRKEKKSIIYI